MTKLRSLLLTCLVGAILLPGTSWANDPEAVIKYRKAVYTSLKGHMGAVAGILRGGLVDYSGHIADHAVAIQNAARIIPSMFPEGSDFGDTDAKENIWTDRAGFEKAAKRLEEASGVLVQAAQSGNMKAVGGAVGKVGGACKGCHDDYRVSN
ncbi:MAG: c-type cytochrome [bacterium]|jgi:cytochrome c556